MIGSFPRLIIVLEALAKPVEEARLLRKAGLLGGFCFLLFGMLLSLPTLLPAQKVGEKPKSTKSDSRKSLDDALLEKLTDGKSAIKKLDGDPLEQAIQSMRQVEKRIAKRETGQETRKLQKQIVTNLEKLIELAKRKKSAPKQPSSSQPKQQKKPNEQQQKGKPGQQQPKETDQTKQSKQSQESTERSDKARKQAAELAKRRRLVKEVWGHLPPTLREKLLNIYSEKTLPKYEDLVRLYYEALAESTRKKTDK